MASPPQPMRRLLTLAGVPLILALVTGAGPAAAKQPQSLQSQALSPVAPWTAGHGLGVDLGDIGPGQR